MLKRFIPILVYSVCILVGMEAARSMEGATIELNNESDTKVRGFVTEAQFGRDTRHKTHLFAGDTVGDIEPGKNHIVTSDKLNADYPKNIESDFVCMYEYGQTTLSIACSFTYEKGKSYISNFLKNPETEKYCCTVNLK